MVFLGFQSRFLGMSLQPIFLIILGLVLLITYGHGIFCLCKIFFKLLQILLNSKITLAILTPKVQDLVFLFVFEVWIGNYG